MAKSKARFPCMDQAPLLTSKEVATRFRVSINTVHRLAERGDLKGQRVGRLWRFAPEAVEAYLASATYTPEVEPIKASA